MRPTLRDRLVMPLLLPVAVIVVIAAALYAFSRILLSVTASAATVTATVVAIGVMAIASVAASRRQVRLSTLGAMVGATAGVAMLAGGIALAVVAGTEEAGEEPGGAVVAIAAVNIAFEPTMVTTPAGEPFTIRFHNQDADTPHNVEIFDNPGFTGEPLFAGEVFNGVREMDYPVPPLEPGPYFFRCVVHPTTMIGELRAEGGPPGGEGGGPAGPGLTVVAQNIAFDTDTIELPAGTPTPLTFENRDPDPHNVAIYTDSNLDQELFSFAPIPGPVTERFEIPALEAGEYYFLCIVHPNMNGTVVVDGGGPPEPTGGT